MTRCATRVANCVQVLTQYSPGIVLCLSILVEDDITHRNVAKRYPCLAIDFTLQRLGQVSPVNELDKDHAAPACGSYGTGQYDSCAW